MLQSIRSYVGLIPQVLEKGLAHPSFLGRAVSWGVFYGVMALIVKKIAVYARPYFQKLWNKGMQRLGYQQRTNIQEVDGEEEKAKKKLSSNIKIPSNVAIIEHGMNQYFIQVQANIVAPVHGNLVPSSFSDEEMLNLNIPGEGSLEGKASSIEQSSSSSSSISISTQIPAVDTQKKNRGYFG